MFIMVQINNKLSPFKFGTYSGNFYAIALFFNFLILCFTFNLIVILINSSKIVLIFEKCSSSFPILVCIRWSNIYFSYFYYRRAFHNKGLEPKLTFKQSQKPNEKYNNHWSTTKIKKVMKWSQARDFGMNSVPWK